MPFVERDGSGVVKGTYANPQPGFAEEFLADDHPDVVAFNGRPVRALPVTTEELIDVLIAKDLIVDADLPRR